MATKNKYVRRSRISEAKVRELVLYFAADLTALQAATFTPSTPRADRPVAAARHCRHRARRYSAPP